MIRAVAWDIDGTLIDSEPLHLVALQAVCGRYDVDISDLSDERFRGVHMFDVWKELGPRFPATLSRDSWLAQITDAYVERTGELRFIADAGDVVAGLAAQGLRQVCVSNSGRRIVDANIAALGIASLIDFSISLDDVGAGKPDPEPYAAACARLGLSPVDVMAIEDSQTGATSAHRAGLFVLGFASDGQRFEGADAVVSALREVPPLLSEKQHLSSLAPDGRARAGAINSEV